MKIRIIDIHENDYYCDEDELIDCVGNYINPVAITDDNGEVWYGGRFYPDDPIDINGDEFSSDCAISFYGIRFEEVNEFGDLSVTW